MVKRTMQTLLKDWSDDHSARFQKEVMTFRHGLADTGLFEDAALLDLLERHPDHLTDVCTMDADSDPTRPNRFLTGDFRGVSAQTLLDAAKAGKIWINLRQAMNVHPDYKAVLDAMYGGLAAATGNAAYNARGGILISSPIARVPYHFDKTETILWHVRGRKNLYLWPVSQKYIPDTAHESKLTNLLDDDLPYTEAFEAEATVLELEPGQAATWPLNAPHRVDNKTFCVSVTTEYSTRESAMKNATMMTNSALRRYLKLNPLYENDGAVARRWKSLAGRVIKKTKIVPDSTSRDMVAFRIDPDVEGYLVDVEPVERTF